MSEQKKQRLDSFLHAQYPEHTRSRIQDLIKQGAVTIDGVTATKPGVRVASNADIVIDFGKIPYVSRAGQKLAHALDVFDIDVTGLRVLDAGLSTGGFADCLLQRGAQRVYGVDVGTAQVRDSLRDNDQLTVLENTDIRDVDLGLLGNACVDMVTLDLSFISVTKVLEHVAQLVCPAGVAVILIKPQFEVGKKYIAKSGVVKDVKQIERVLEKVKNGLESCGLHVNAIIESPILGGSGNKEFLAYARKIATGENR